MKQASFHETVALKLIEQLKQGTAPWIKPWMPGEPGTHLPTNPVTGTRYKGINALHLLAQDYLDPRWMTYKQASSLGAQVRKGEKATGIQYWRFSEERPRKDEQGHIMFDEQGEPLKETIRLERPQVFYAHVFNAGQIDGLPPLEQKQEAWPRLERAESLLQHSGARLIHSEHDRAFYRPATDSIHLPPKHQFEQAALYYATALHELSHWTGHTSRLNRDLSHPFGSEGYAKEELRAEIASLLLGEELHLGHDPGQHVAYIKSWIRILEDDPMELFRAAADAEKIQHHLLSLEQQHVLLLENEPHQAILLPEAKTMPHQFTTEKTRLVIPYEEKDRAKALIGRLPDGKAALIWDNLEKSWFAQPGVPLETLKPWLPDKAPYRQEPALTSAQEFSEALRSLDCLVEHPHPLMDGKTHRIAVSGDKRGEKAGFYVAHLDGHPAGYIKNNRTGVELTWNSKGYFLSAEDKERLQQDLEVKRQLRMSERLALQEQTAQRLQQRLNTLTPLDCPTPYLKAKGIPVCSGLFTDKGTSTTYIPAFDEFGKVWGLQSIQADGLKRFAKGSRKEGCFHPVGGMNALEQAPILAIAEGYATAATVSQALGFGTVAAFDAGNIKGVALNLRARYPDKPILILGDDDKALEIAHQPNTGKVHALAAAEAVNGKALFPIFAPLEQSEHPRTFTDFNDLAVKSQLGVEGVQRQLKPVVAELIAEVQTKQRQRRYEKRPALTTAL